MICFPNAKINLGLNILSKRPDGYHEIESIFYPIKLKDALEIIPSKEKEPFIFFPSGIEIESSKKDNLVIKALDIIKSQKHIPNIDIHLLKKIPIGAGLGGGSSDAAFMIKLLNSTFSLNYSDIELINLAKKIGADCSFFIKNSTSYVTGIGDKIEEIELDLSNINILIIKPNIFISTKEAYSLIKPKEKNKSLKDDIKKNIYEWKNYIKNDFEDPIFYKYPELQKIKNYLYKKGAIYASMTGSGSSIFGLFDKEIDFDIDIKNCFIWKDQLW